MINIYSVEAQRTVNLFTWIYIKFRYQYLRFHKKYEWCAMHPTGSVVSPEMTKSQALSWVGEMGAVKGIDEINKIIFFSPKSV